MFDTLMKRCYHNIRDQNSHFLFNLPPELPIQFLEKAILEIEFIQQKSIVQFKHYQKSPSVIQIINLKISTILE